MSSSSEDRGAELPEQLLPEQNPPPNYSRFVLSVLRRMSRGGEHVIDQEKLRTCILLSSSYLLADSTMDASGGVQNWFLGFSRLIDVIVALHARSELEIETMNAASKACSECWGVAGAWRGLEECRDSVRKVAVRLKKLLDENGRTYQGERVYAP